MTRPGFGLQLVIAFFVFDAVEKSATAGALLAARIYPTDPAHFRELYFPLLLALSFDVLLAVQLALGTRAGRFWAIIYLLATTSLSLFLLVAEPGRWLDLGTTGRLRDVATIGLNLGFLGILLGRRSAKALAR